MFSKNSQLCTCALIMESIMLPFKLVCLQNRCVNMIAHLFNAPLEESEIAVGVGTVGSSEAIMLAGLAFKRRWQNRRKLEGKPYDNPNIVTGANVQVHKKILECSATEILALLKIVFFPKSLALII